jgi:hypothetical protein
MRAELQQKLGQFMDRHRDVTKDDVQRALQSNRFDNYTMPAGAMVLEYPHLLNAFVDRFYLEVLAGKPL